MQGRAIYRYKVPVDDRWHQIAAGDPVGVGCRDVQTVEFWVVHDNAAPARDVRSFMVVGTGHPLPEGRIRIWGTATAPGGQFVWHLIEMLP
jgi:hypothetical protein